MDSHLGQGSKGAVQNKASEVSAVKRYPLILAILLAGAVAAQADSLVTTRPAGTDSVDWSQLGPGYTTISNPFSFTTTDGVAGTGSYANSSDQGEVRVQSSSWYGNFGSGDIVNSTDLSAGAVTLNFSQGYTQIGSQVESVVWGPFTAQICDVNGCFTENGNSDGSGDNSAIYIGIESGLPINWVTFSLTSAPYGTTNSFGINDVTMNGSNAPVVPEPSTLLLLGTGMLGLGWLLVRRKNAASIAPSALQI